MEAYLASEIGTWGLPNIGQAVSRRSTQQEGHCGTSLCRRGSLRTLLLAKLGFGAFPI